MKPPHINQSMGAVEWGLLLALSLVWGGAFFFSSIAVSELPPFTIVILRVGIAAMVLHLVVRMSGVRLPTEWHVWRAFFVMGLLNNAIPFSLLVWGQTHISGGLASILNATTPMFTVLVAHAMTSDEKITPTRIVGVFAGLLGVAIMIGEDALQALSVDILAQIACIAAPVSYALAGVYGRRFKELGVAPMATATGQVTASTFILLPLALIVDHPWALPMPSTNTILAIVGLATLSTALAYIIFFRILSTAGATNLSLATFMIPVSAIFLGGVFLGEVLETKHFVGMLMIGIGLAAIDGRLLRCFRR
jgi:drug/metabolite transporter (DMT)-like permease